MDPFLKDDFLVHGPIIARPEADVVLDALLQGRDVLLTGQKGIGKSHLLRIVADALTERDHIPICIGLRSEFTLKEPLEPAPVSHRDVMLFDDVDALDSPDAEKVGALLASKPDVPAILAGVDVDAVRRMARRAGSSGDVSPTHVELSRVADTDVRSYLLGQFTESGWNLGPILDEFVQFADGHLLTASLLTHHLGQYLAEGDSVEHAWTETCDEILRDVRDPFERLWAAHTSDADRRVIRALAAGARSLFAADTLKQFELSKSSASRARDRLLRSGEIRQAPDGRYHLTDPLYGIWVVSRQRTNHQTTRPLRQERQVRTDPFGAPDASRADLAELNGDFVPVRFLGGRGLPRSTVDIPRARVIVGRKGSGKTLYLRRLQMAATRDPSIYADLISASPPPTSNVIWIANIYPRLLLTEAWMLLWRAAILRSTASHLLRSPALVSHLGDYRAPLQLTYDALGGRSTVPLSVGAELRDLTSGHPSRAHLDGYLADPRWDDLMYYVSGALQQAPPISFYLDGLDEDFRHAPWAWLACQKGLFFEVMRLLRDPGLGGRLHVVIGIRDVVLSSVLASEHATRYHTSPHVQILNWDAELSRDFLEAKVKRLPNALLMIPSARPSIFSWLGRDSLENPVRGKREDLADYIVRHTRLLPRDIIILGNELCAAVHEARSRKVDLTDERIREVVAHSARLFGREQLSIAANQIASEVMPPDAPAKGYDDFYTSDHEYSYRASTETILVDTLRRAKTDRFAPSVLRTLDEDFRRQFGDATDVPSVLWQNGLLGYINDDSAAVFRETGQTDDMQIPRTWKSYVLHTTLIDVLGLRPRTAAASKVA